MPTTSQPSLASDAKIEYYVELILDGGKSVPAAGRLMEELNANLSLLGADEQLVLTTRVRVGRMTARKALTAKEIFEVQNIILDEFQRSSLSFSHAITAVDLVRRKPGHVSPSAS